MKISDTKVHTEPATSHTNSNRVNVSVDFSTHIKIKLSSQADHHDLSLPSDFTLGDLKQAAQGLGVEHQLQKLLFTAIEKGNNDHLSMTGVKDNSKILLIVEESPKKENHEEVNAPSEVSVGLAAVAEVREEVNKLSEQVSALEAVIQYGIKVEEKNILHLTEILMRQMLTLDGIEAQGEGRQQRRIEVRRVQSLVERLDTLKAKNSKS